MRYFIKFISQRICKIMNNSLIRFFKNVINSNTICLFLLWVLSLWYCLFDWRLFKLISTINFRLVYFFSRLFIFFSSFFRFRRYLFDTNFWEFLRFSLKFFSWTFLILFGWLLFLFFLLLFIFFRLYLLLFW